MIIKEGQSFSVKKFFKGKYYYTYQIPPNYRKYKKGMEKPISLSISEFEQLQNFFKNNPKKQICFYSKDYDILNAYKKVMDKLPT